MIPSYDDLEPPITDIGTSRRDLTAYVRRLFERSESQHHEASATAVRSVSTLYACVYLIAPAAPSAPDLLSLGRSFSPRCAMHGDRTLVIDASGLGRLLGMPAQIGRELHRAAVDSGLEVRVALSASRIAAVLLAETPPSGAPGTGRGGGRSGVSVLVVPPGSERAAVASLPIHVLRQFDQGTDEGRRPRPRGGSSKHYRMAPAPGAGGTAVPAGRMVSTLERWGITTVGEFAALPAAQLSERLGEHGLVLHRIARAEDVAPLVPAPPEERFEQSMSLEWPIETLEPLSFVLARLLDPLCTQLEQRDRGAAAVHVRLRLVTRDVHTRTLQLPAPFRDPRVLRTLILLDLESHPPSAGIDEVFITVDPTPGRIVQFSLLEYAQPSPEDLSTLTARLTALLGGGRCGAPALMDTHAPGAFELRPAGAGLSRDLTPVGAGRSGPPTAAATDPPLLPCTRGAGIAQGAVLRRFRVPIAARVKVERGRPVRVDAGRGLSGGAVVTSAGPWRTSGNWWHEEGLPHGSALAAVQAVFNKDEWDVALAEGTIYRLSRDRDFDRWYIEGTLD